MAQPWRGQHQSDADRHADADEHAHRYRDARVERNATMGDVLDGRPAEAEATEHGNG
jgi:hypothetical protein